MKLGILSDSHGKVEMVRRALAVLRARGADTLIHCGDVGGLEVLEELAGWRGRFVWGNTDFPHPSWRSHVEALELPWPEGPLDLTLAGKRIAVFHGHEHTFTRTVDAARHDYLFHGHTHRRADHRVADMRVINPGALHRALAKTVALLDLERDELAFIEIDGVLRRSS